MWLMPSGQGCASAGAQKTETKRKSIIRVRFIVIASGPVHIIFVIAV
jgi:uncharacterized membrane protein YvbJ